MKVGLISPSETLCGVAEHVHTLRPALERQGVETTLIEIDLNAVDRLSGRQLESLFRGLAEKAAKVADIVHVQHEYRLFARSGRLADSLAALRALYVGLAAAEKPLFITWHSLPPRPATMSWRTARHLSAYLQWRRLMRELNTSSTTRSVAHSQFARVAMARVGMAEEKVVVIPVGSPELHHSISGPERIASVRAVLGIPADATVLVLFGFVSAYKGHRTALAALERLGPDHHLIVAGGVHPRGDSSAVARLERMVEASPSLAGRVHITGHLEVAQIPKMLELADVCLAPYESWAALAGSGAVTRAIASGKPVIASALPVFRELNEQSECLVLVPPGDPAALAAAVTRVVASADLRVQMRRNAQAFCERFSWDEVAKMHARAYAAAIESRG